MQRGINLRWIKSSALWQIIFILIILYSVSSINVLILAMGILPYLQGAILNAPVLVYFAEISFAIASIISIYHLSTIFRRRKRRDDRAEDQKRVNLIEVWVRSRLLNKLLVVLILLFGVFSGYTFLWGQGFAGNIFNTEVDITWIIYSIFAFSLTTLLASFHLATLIFRQKRTVDILARAQRMENK